MYYTLVRVRALIVYAWDLAMSAPDSSFSFFDDCSCCSSSSFSLIVYCCCCCSTDVATEAGWFHHLHAPISLFMSPLIDTADDVLIRTIDDTFAITDMPKPVNHPC